MQNVHKDQGIEWASYNAMGIRVGVGRCSEHQHRSPNCRQIVFFVFTFTKEHAEKGENILGVCVCAHVSTRYRVLGWRERLFLYMHT